MKTCRLSFMYLKGSNDILGGYMVIDFDGLTILISVIIFVVASIILKVITKKTYIYYIRSLSLSADG